MTPQEVEFLRRLVDERPAERRSRLADRFCKEEALGVSSGPKVVYRPADYLRASSLLQSRGFELVATPKGFARSQAPAGGSEKSGARAVTQDLVAVSPIGMNWLVPSGGFLGLPWEKAAHLPYEVLLVCENLESFYQLDRYQWLDRYIRGRPALALFRGMVHTFRTDAAAKLISADDRPTLAFFDYDPKGLAMAASLPRREALCLPDWEQLEPAVKAAKRYHLFADSFHVCRVQLDAQLDPGISLAWQRMKLLTMGLNQEGFPRQK